jgi:uncharacterized protein with ParB-like and HNH nuclease domain
MATKQTVTSQDITVGDVFKDFYIVPDYQREYVWAEEVVEQLFADIYIEYSSNGDRKATEEDVQEYFIGSIVVCARSDNEFEVIDGQQRITTLYIFLCAVRDYIERLSVKAPQPLLNQIAASYMQADGEDVQQCRVVLQYEDSGDILRYYAKEDGHEAPPTKSTLSISNINNARKAIDLFLRTQFKESVAEVKKYYSYLTNKVKLIRIQTTSVTHALKIFETINDRGQGLDSMDLLKNLMFIHAKQKDYALLKREWKDIVDTLFAAREKPLRFLRYFIFAAYEVDRLREDEIFQWFKANETLCGYRDNPIAFVKLLKDAASDFSRFVKGQDQSGQENRHLQNLRLLSGTARQQFILLLAARKMPTDLFADLCKHVESLFFVHLITRENTREFERKFAQWAQSLRKVLTREELDEFLNITFERAKQDLSSRFDLAMLELSVDSIQQYRLRYVMGKLTQFVNEQAYGSGAGTERLESFIDKSIHIEHILPQAPSKEALGEFDAKDSVDDYVGRLGNLCLVEQAINTSLGNKPFSEKRLVYPKSKFLLTQTIAVHVKIGSNTAIDRAVQELTPFDVWTSDAIRKRQKMLQQLARKVWSLPVSEVVAAE